MNLTRLVGLVVLVNLSIITASAQTNETVFGDDNNSTTPFDNTTLETTTLIDNVTSNTTPEATTTTPIANTTIPATTTTTVETTTTTPVPSTTSTRTTTTTTEYTTSKPEKECSSVTGAGFFLGFFVACALMFGVVLGLYYYRKRNNIPYGFL